MDRYFTQTIGTLVLTTSGTLAGRITDIVIDPESGKLMGFLLGFRGEFVIAPTDVLFWDDKIFIQDEEDILETNEIIKVQEVLNKNISILNRKVTTKKGKVLGKVFDIGINPKFFIMTKIAVAKSIFGLFPFDEKLIARADILKINKDCIVVRDSEEKVLVKEKASAKEKLRIDIAPSTMQKNSD